MELAASSWKEGVFHRGLFAPQTDKSCSGLNILHLRSPRPHTYSPDSRYENECVYVYIIYTYIYIHIHICTHNSRPLSLSLSLHTQIYIYIYIYVYPNIHIHIHTHGIYMQYSLKYVI